MTVSVWDSSERETLPDGRKKINAIYRTVLVCSKCVEECEGAGCPNVDIDKHLVEVKSADCEHCAYCEGEKAETELCHDFSDRLEHVCEKDGDSPCFPCQRCVECAEGCCDELQESDHYGEVYALERVLGGRYACPVGHDIDNDALDNHFAAQMMREAGVPELV